MSHLPLLSFTSNKVKYEAIPDSDHRKNPLRACDLADKSVTPANEDCGIYQSHWIPVVNKYLIVNESADTKTRKQHGKSVSYYHFSDIPSQIGHYDQSRLDGEILFFDKKGDALPNGYYDKGKYISGSRSTRPIAPTVIGRIVKPK